MMKNATLKDIKRFVKETLKSGNYDVYNVSDLKQIIEKAIEHYSMNVVIDFDEEEEFEYIKLTSMEEEELIEMILKLAVNDGMRCSLEYIFEGEVIREY